MVESQYHVESRLLDYPCEDFALTGSNFAIVTDGASSLESDYAPEGYLSDGEWFSEFINSQLANRSSENHSMNKILKQSITSAKERYENMKNESNISKVETPCCALSWIRWDETENCFEYLALGDCILILELEDKNLHIKDPGPSILDEQLIEEWGEKYDGGERPEGMKDEIYSNRRLMNDPDGYRAVGFDSDCAYNAIHAEIPLSRVKSALLFTDGFEPVVDKYELFESWDAVRSKIREDGIESVVEVIRDFERADDDLVEVNRLKQSDDIGVAFVDFEK